MNYTTQTRKIHGVKTDNVPTAAPGIYAIYIDGEYYALVATKNMGGGVPSQLSPVGYPDRYAAFKSGRLTFRVLYQQEVYDKAALVEMKRKITTIGVNDFQKL